MRTAPHPIVGSDPLQGCAPPAPCRLHRQRWSRRTYELATDPLLVSLLCLSKIPCDRALIHDRRAALHPVQVDAQAPDADVPGMRGRWEADTLLTALRSGKHDGRLKRQTEKCARSLIGRESLELAFALLDHV